jgi:hypothetical protein
MVAGCDRADVSSNQLIDIGPDNSHSDDVLGIAGDEFSTLDVRGNAVSLGDSGGASIDVPLWVAPITAAKGLPLLSFVGAAVAAAAADAGQPEVGMQVPPTMFGRPDLGVFENAFSATGVSPIARINSGCNVVFSENRCVRDTKRADKPSSPVVTIATRFAMIVSANRVEGYSDRKLPVVDLHPTSANKLPMFTVLGNIATGPINVNGNPLGAPWHPLNVLTP